MLCTREGLPVAIEVFEGNTGDPGTVRSQVDNVKARFKLARVVLIAPLPEKDHERRL